MKHTFLFILSFFAAGLMAVAQPPEVGKQTLYQVSDPLELRSLNGDWKFYYSTGGTLPAECMNFQAPSFDDSGWRSIPVPSNWDMHGVKTWEYQNYEEAFGLYRRSFVVDPSWDGKHVIIRFDGVLFGYELYVNGNYVGNWESAYNPCQFDITPYLEMGKENLLAVKVTTRATAWRFDIHDDWALAGIYRDVALFAVTDLHLSDVTFRSFLSNDNTSARLTFDIDYASFSKNGSNERVQVLLRDRLGQLVTGASAPVILTNGNGTTSFEQTVSHSRLWSAETPYLYELEVRLVRPDNSIIQRVTEKVGIREISIKETALTINGRPVTLRGMCINDLDPLRGRALTMDEIYRDLTLLKAANVNLLRDAHYPLDKRVAKLCDEMGFYFIVEVPFGSSGKDLLANPDYLEHLLVRTEATVARDKNHPSVIIWSTGNENPQTANGIKVLEYLREKDPTRPRGMPMVNEYFRANKESIPDVASIYMPHYLHPHELDSIAKWSKRPIILTEFAHSLGLSFEPLNDVYNVMRNYKNVAGGCIWMFNDQGLLETATREQFLADTLVQGVWRDSTSRFNTFADKGTDGVVYPDRYPSEDYWVVKNVYTPVAINTPSSLSVEPGKQQQIAIELFNRFDFVSLEGYTVEWELKNGEKTEGRGLLRLSAKAQTGETLHIDANIPDDLSDVGGALYLKVYDPRLQPVSYKGLRLRCAATTPSVPDRVMQTTPPSKRFVFAEQKNGYTLTADSYRMQADRKGKILITGSNGDTLVNSSLLLRVGRKETINVYAFKIRHNRVEYWYPYLLEPRVNSTVVGRKDNEVSIAFHCRWDRVDKPGQYVEGTITLAVAKNGCMHWTYDLKPYHGTGSFFECGLSLVLGPSLSVVNWLGQGPYSNTPRKETHNQYGMWAKQKDDLSFNGNRSEVSAALFGSEQSPLLGYAANERNLSFEKLDNGRIVVSDNALVSGYGAKFVVPAHIVHLKEVDRIRGSFMLQVVETNRHKNYFDTLFPLYRSPLPEIPFAKSYGF